MRDELIEIPALSPLDNLVELISTELNLEFEKELGVLSVVNA